LNNTTKKKITNNATASAVKNLTSAFTSTVTDLPTSTKSTGNYTPDNLLEVKSIVIEEDVASILSSLVGKRFVFSKKKIDKLKTQLVY